MAGLAPQAAAGKIQFGLIVIGGDDFRDIATGAVDPQQAAAAGLTNTVTAIRTLEAANPNLRLLVANVPDITKTPGARVAVAQDPSLAPRLAQLSGLVSVYDAELAGQFAGDDRAAVVDINGLFGTILSDPRQVFPGEPLDTQTPGKDPSHLFVDPIHPGTIGQGFIANAFIDAIDTKFGGHVRRLSPTEILAAADQAAGGPSAVPLPPALWALLVSLPLLVFAVRRQGAPPGLRKGV